MSGTERGNIKVYNSPLGCRPFDEFNAHSREVSQICVSPDARFVFTAGIDGTVFIYGVTEYWTEGEMYKDKEEKANNAQFQNRDLIVDEELAGIVLIKWNEMEEWTKK